MEVVSRAAFTIACAYDVAFRELIAHTFRGLGFRLVSRAAFTIPCAYDVAFREL